jgi:polysaccharide biosynthesis protein VpsJ
MIATTTEGRLDLYPVAAAVWRHCKEAGFSGHDPYDGLKSRLLAPLFGRSRLLRLAVIQTVKRSPVNLRPLLDIPAGLNPKGLALLLMASACVPRLAFAEDRRQLAYSLAALASLPDGAPVFPGRRPWPGMATAFAERAPAAAGWGYDFPWQARAFHQPAFAPTVVATSFVVDAFAASGHAAAGAVTRAAAGFVRRHLHRHEDTSGVCYSYSPNDRSRVFNASLFAGKILAREAALVADDDPAAAASLRAEAVRTVAYVLARQRPDGSWVYGEANHWQWIDNLHSGFVLETIAAIAALLGTPRRWDEPLARGLAHYRAHLIGPDAAPWYHAGRPWPLDSHTVAQTALTLLAFRDREPALAALSRRVLEVGIERLWDPARRGFVHQRGRIFTHRTIYLRWSQAWLLHALCAQIAHEEGAA